MKYFFIAGEASGDLHGSNLIKALRGIDPSVELVGYGGEKMEAAGMRLLHHYKDIAVMGFLSVVMKLPTILNNMKECADFLQKEKPDAVILIDYPGFNLRMAKAAHKLGIKVLYYIAPKVWASRPGRVKKIRAYCDKVFSILPFELDFFRNNGVEIEYVGNPLLDEMAARNNTESLQQFKDRTGLDNRPIIACLAGSRRSEIKNNLPKMMEVIPKFPDYQVVLAGVPSLGEEIYEPYVKGKDIQLLFSETHNILKHAHAAMITSGTATLEGALYNVPQVVCYKFGGGWFIQTLVHWIMTVPYISLVNLIRDKEVVKELMEVKFTYTNLKDELHAIVYNKAYRKQMREEYDQIRQDLGGVGASSKAAHKITQYMLASVKD